MKSPAFLCTLFCAILVFWAAPAQAHRIAIDSIRLPDGRLRVEVYYADGRPAMGAEITVRSAGGAEVARGTTDGGGIFEFTAPTSEDLEVEARHEGTHRATQRILRREVPASPSPEALPAAAPGAQAPPAAAARPRGAFPIWNLLAGIVLIAILSALLSRVLKGRRAS